MGVRAGWGPSIHFDRDPLEEVLDRIVEVVEDRAGPADLQIGRWRSREISEAPLGLGDQAIEALAVGPPVIGELAEACASQALAIVHPRTRRVDEMLQPMAAAFEGDQVHRLASHVADPRERGEVPVRRQAPDGEIDIEIAVPELPGERAEEPHLAGTELVP